MLNTLSDAQSQASVAAAASEAAAANTAEVEKKLEKQRRRSRELENQIFGMQLTDVDLLKKKFDEIDIDHSGSIDTTELREALLKVGKTPTDDQVKLMIKKFDADGNGTLEVGRPQALLTSLC